MMDDDYWAEGNNNSKSSSGEFANEQADFFNIPNANNNNNGQQQQQVEQMERDAVDFVEIASLCVLIAVGTVLNAIAFTRLVRYARKPCRTGGGGGGSVKSTKSLLLSGGGPIHFNAFALLKFHLALTDFAILLVHALGKLIWLLSYRWLFGDVGCRLYQFLSAFAYYSNSFVVVAIGVDRLKVVYSSRVQGTITSIRRVRLFLSIAWALAAICALPQLVFWTDYELAPGWSQCTTIWQIAEHVRVVLPPSTAPSKSAGAGSSDDTPPMLHWSAASPQTQFYYELLHQAAVFVIPFISLLACYLLIVLRILRYNLRCPGSSSFGNFNSYSSLMGPDNWSAGAEEPAAQKRNSLVALGWRLRKICSSFQQKQQQKQKGSSGGNSSSCWWSPDRLAVPNEGICLSPGPPPSPKTPITGFPAPPPLSNSAPICPSSAINREILLMSTRLSRTASAYHHLQRKMSAAEFGENGEQRLLLNAAASMVNNSKRRSLNVVPTIPNGNFSALNGPSSLLGGSGSNAAALLFNSVDSIVGGGVGAQQQPLPNASRRHSSMYCYRSSLASSASMRGGGGGAGTNFPFWRRQLRSRVFVRALLIVAAHCAFWLPYNLLNLLRFADEAMYASLVEKGALLVEDLIVLNAMINPILYGYGR